MIGSAAGIEAEVGPVAEVAVAPHGDSGFGSIGGCGVGGAGEGFEVQEGPLGGGEGDVLGLEAVPAGFVVGVAGEVWLRAGYINALGVPPRGI